MSITIYVGWKKAKFTFDCGWYKGENFSLLSVNLFDTYDDIANTIFSVKIIKFIIGLYVELVDPAKDEASNE